MKTTLQTILLFSFLLSSLTLSAQCSCAPPFIIPAGNSMVNVFAGETYCFNAGIYTGNINVYAGGKICISQFATFIPGTINNFEGVIENYGTLTINPNFSFSSGALIENYGVFNLNSIVNFIDSGTITNMFTGKLFLNNDFNLTNNSTFNNYGIVVSNGPANDFTTDVNSNVNNYGIIRILDGKFTNGGTLLNEGMIYVGKEIDYNSGSNVTNNCRIIGDKGLTLKSIFVNNGLVWLTGTNPTAAHFDLFAGSQLTNGVNAQVRGIRFTNKGTVNGYGEFHFTETTRQQGVFIGTSAVNPIRFFDVTQTGTQILDIQSPAPTNTLRPATMTLLDTLVFGNICLNQNYRDLVNLILPIKLNYFNGECIDGQIKLSWVTSEEINITGYNVEGSKDGKTFEVVGNVFASGKDFNYAYSTINTEYKYFRLAIQEKGYESYSNVIPVSCPDRFQTIQNAIVNPNPNNGIFTIDFDTEITGEIELKVINTQSKVIYTNNFEAKTGNNSVVVELNNVPPGIYISTIKDKQGNTRHMRFVVE